MNTLWADQVIADVLKRKEKSYLVTDYKTPSGKIHVGSLRGVIIHDVIYRGLIDAYQKTEFWYGFDDFDPMDGLPKNLEKKFKKYMGEPLCNIPSPDGDQKKNFAKYFAQEFKNIYRSLGVKSKTVWASELYKSGKYNKAIQIILNNADKIRKIYKNVSGSQKPKDWHAFQTVCPKCGKIGTTRVYNWDGKKVSFVCEPKIVDWAEGCGHQGKISPYNGAGKMPYKVETAAKWFSFGTSVELAGKDHYTKGGTFYVAYTIAKEIFKVNPAYGFGYEHFLTGGKKMCSSKGIGVTASEIAEILPPELLRFLMVRTRAKRAIDFDIYDETIPRLYDEYDHCIDEYFRDPKSEFGRAYYYSKISEDAPPKYRLRFSKIAYLLQMFREDIIIHAEKEKGSKLTNDEKKELKIREEYAGKWLDKFAPEKYQFRVHTTIPSIITKKPLNKSQKEFLAEIINILRNKKLKGEEIHQEIHNIKKRQKIDPRKAFSAIYLSLIGKDSGPQAGWMLYSLREIAIDRFNKIINLK